MLEIDHLSLEYYRRGSVIPAVRDVSLSIAPGETLGLVGESGSGKSSVALAVLRLIRPQEGRITSGRLLFHGEDLASMSVERLRAIRGKRISMIFQDPFTSLNPVMRVRDQMREAAPSASLEEALNRVQLEPSRVLASYPHQLSGGQRQRVMIAMALLNRPEFLLADEPTTALDVIIQKEILELLFRLQQELGMGMLFVSHNLGLVARYTKQVAVMKEGRIVESGSPERIFTSPEHPYTRQLIAALPRL